MSATSRARDFVARFVTDTSEFDTSPIDRGLQDTATRVQTVTNQVTEGGKGLVTRARDVGRNAGQAIAQGLGDAAASGDIGGALQSVAGSLAGLGVAGLGIGVGVGLIGNVIKGMQQAEKDVQAAAKSLFETIQKEGAAAAQAQRVEAKFQEVVQDPDKVASLALLGITPDEWSRAASGVNDDIVEVRRKIAEAGTVRHGAGPGANAVYEQQAAAVREATGELDRYADALDRANTSLQRVTTRARDSYLDQIYNPNSRRVG